MTTEQLQDLCEQGQAALMATDYLLAEKILAQAENAAWDSRDFNTLARLYMPLQEARRQKRQQCGEGFVCLDLVANGVENQPDPRRVTEMYRRGTMLVAGWGTIEPATAVREIARQENLYLETFLAASYAVGGGIAVLIVPSSDVALPESKVSSIDELIRKAPVGALVKNFSDLPRGARTGTPETYAQTMAMWEQLHAPFLAAADATAEPIRKIEAYRKTIRVDYACELAHQRLSETARELGHHARR
jgi:hypothetical protein